MTEFTKLILNANEARLTSCFAKSRIVFGFVRCPLFNSEGVEVSNLIHSKESISTGVTFSTKESNLTPLGRDVHNPGDEKPTPIGHLDFEQLHGAPSGTGLRVGRQCLVVLREEPRERQHGRAQYR